MKKYFLSIFVFLFLLIQNLVLPLQTFAAGETWTWQANGSIVVTGGQLNAPATIPKNGQGYLLINDTGSPGGYCALSVLPQFAADNKSATVEGGFNVGTPPHAACSAAIQKQYWGTTVQLAGTPPGPVGGIPTFGGCPKGQYPFDATYYDGNADAIPPAPATLTFTVGNQTMTAKGTVENGAFGVDVSYVATFCLAPGTPTVCIVPPQPDFKCSQINMPAKPFAQTFGKRLSTEDVNVSILILSTDTGPFDITLSGNGINKTIQGTPPGNPGSGCTNIAQVIGTFFNIKPGSYQVCYKKNNICQTLNQVAGAPGNVVIDVSKAESNGGGCTPTDQPPPPSPPCETWANGECTMFNSPFAGFSTDPEGFIEKIFAILLSLSGGIALLLIIKAGYQMMTAQGNPEKLNNAREQLVAAIVGLVFLIFSFVFLQLIGFDILHIPGFGAGAGTAVVTKCNPNACVPLQTCQALLNGQAGGKCVTNGCAAGGACNQ